MRTLPLLVAPVDDETLLSFCRRLAAHNEASLGNVLRACGLGGDRPKLQVVPQMAFVLDADVVGRFAESTGITAERAQRLLLGSYRHALDIADCPRNRGRDRLQWARRRGVLARGSRACPKCLCADGAFRMAWRFEWSFACPEHAVLLEAACRRCSRPYTYEPGHRPTQSSLVPVLTGCGNQEPIGRASTGLNCRPCGHPFSEVPLRAAIT